jgi:putative tryptophan/tyrosine transport system substrate-binding protein
MPTTLNQGVTRKCNPSFFVQATRETSTMPANEQRRRIVAAIATIAAGIAGAQQPTRKYRIGYLSLPKRESVEPVLQIFLRALRDLGLVDGDNLAIEYRWADGEPDQLPAMASDLVRREVDLIVAPAAAAALAAKNATRTIPIVMVFPADPVALGLVQSLQRPGGNVTGTAYAHDARILRKQLEVLKDALPRASRVAVLASPADPLREIQRREYDAAARAMALDLRHFEARGPQDFAAAFSSIGRMRAQMLCVAGSSFYLPYRRELRDEVLKARLATLYTLREMVEEAAGLIAYAANLSDFIGRAAVYVDKILKGANPAELSIEQPTKFELVVNLRTARTLGIAIPRTVLARADEVIQ